MPQTRNPCSLRQMESPRCRRADEHGVGARAERVGLQSIMVVSHNGRVLGNGDVLKLREHVAHVECKVGEGRPK